MAANNRKFRSVLVGLITLFGLVSLMLAYFSSLSYLNLSIEQERSSLEAVLQLRTDELLKKLKNDQQEMGSRLQKESAFRKAFAQRDQPGLQEQINQAFNRVFVTSGLLDLKQLTVFDNNMEIVSQSMGQNVDINSPHNLSCPELLERAKLREGSDRLKVSTWRCTNMGSAIQSVLVPIGGLSPLGYLQICANPVFNLQHLTDELAMPIQLLSEDHKLLFQSDDWPHQNLDDFLITRLMFNAPDGELLFEVNAAKEIGEFINQLHSSRNRVLVVSVIVIILSLLFVLMIIGRALRPLTELQAAAQRIAKGEYTAIKNYSNHEEIATSIESFNKMSADINRENHSRTLAQEALKQATADAERLAHKAFEEKKFTQTTLNSISDGVITSNTDGRVLFMNPAAVKLTQLDPGSAIGRPLEEVFSTGEESSPLDGDSDGTWANRELRLYRADGEEMDIEATSSVMYSPDGDIIGTVTVFSDVTKQRELTRRLSYAASHDALTGLVNRNEFERRLEETIRIAHMDNSEHTLCYMDLDQFKIVNDTCGHTAGDELLRQLAGLLRSQVSRRDTLGRLGGDEFGLLMENCNLDDAQVVTTRILEAIRRYQFVWEANTFTIGCSFGLVGFDAMGQGLAAIMSAADTACYMAKDKGRNRIEVVRVDDAGLEKRQGEIRWVLEINAALKENRFELYRQRIVSSDENDLEKIRYEILIRMRDKDNELITPDAFLPAAERFDLITKIDQWVIVNAMTWLKEMQDEYPVEISINLSGASIANKNFLDFVVTQIHEFDIDPELICFEVTETAAITNLSHAQRFMNIVTGLGCHFALDDFGSGLSSFAYLKSLPVHYLKIDGLFIRNIHRDPVDLAMVRSINDVGHTLGLKTVAEFVESKEIIEMLQTLKVDFYQGYAIARPEPLNTPLPKD